MEDDGLVLPLAQGVDGLHPFVRRVEALLGGVQFQPPQPLLEKGPFQHFQRVRPVGVHAGKAVELVRVQFAQRLHLVVVHHPAACGGGHVQRQQRRLGQPADVPLGKQLVELHGPLFPHPEGVAPEGHFLFIPADGPVKNGMDVHIDQQGRFPSFCVFRAQYGSNRATTALETSAPFFMHSGTLHPFRMP